MTDGTRPPVWQMVNEAVKALGGSTTNVAIRERILRQYPGTNPLTIQCQIIGCTVNHDSRVHYPENKRPRIANGYHDFLFRTGRGKVEVFDPQRHGIWEIRLGESGRLEVAERDAQPLGRAGDGPGTLAEPESSDGGSEQPMGSGFAAEGHLRDYLASNLDDIERGLQLFIDDLGCDGVEYQTPIGRIDILARDIEGGFVVVELKVGRGPDAVAGQILRYKNWVKANLAGEDSVRGIIIAQEISDRIRYSIAADGEISAMEYEIALKLSPVKPIT